MKRDLNILFGRFLIVFGAVWLLLLSQFTRPPPIPPAEEEKQICTSSEFGRELMERSHTTDKSGTSHLFHFPPTAATISSIKQQQDKEEHPPYLCVPQKNGNRQFGALMYAIWMQEPPQTVDAVLRHMGRWDKHRIDDPDGTVYIITRNPYSRLLSLYMEKVRKSCVSINKWGSCTKKEKIYLGMDSDVSFAEFVQRIYNMSKTRKLCEIDHHLCSQIAICVATTVPSRKLVLLKLEEQSQWFPCFVQSLGLNQTLLRHGWESFSGRSCYYTPTGVCPTYYDNNGQQIIQKQEQDPSGAAVAIGGDVHATGSSGIELLRENYNSSSSMGGETAAIVRKLYEDDFRLLGYPLEQDWSE